MILAACSVVSIKKKMSKEMFAKSISVVAKSHNELENKSTEHFKLLATLSDQLNNQISLLEDKERIFNDSKKLVEGALERFNSHVKLNVGGHKYETTLTTLGAGGENCMLTTMFSGRHELKTNEDNEVFIDRDGTHFGYILNMLRDSTVEVPAKHRGALQSELQYYSISATRCQRLIRWT